MNTAAMLIRLAYAPSYDEAARAWRFAYFREHVLPRILHQRGADFDLWIWVNPAHRAEVEAMDPRIRTFTVRRALPLESRIPWADVRELPRYAVQIRLDSDDLIGPRFVSTALQTLRTMPAPRALVFFDPWKLDIATGRIYLHHREYRRHRASAFLALRQPGDAEPYLWVYGIGHTRMHRQADAVRGIGLGHAWMSVHGLNDTTALHRKDTLIDAPEAQPTIWWKREGAAA